MTTRPSPQGRERNERTSENGWSAGTSGRRQAAGKPDLEGRGDKEAGALADQRCVGVTWRVDKPMEGSAIAARKAMSGSSGSCGIVLMSNMRDRIEREGQQQSGEDDSQPLRRSSGQMEQAHSER